MLKRIRGHKHRVVSHKTAYGTTVGKALDNAQPFIDKHYKETARGFDRERNMHFVKLEKVH